MAQIVCHRDGEVVGDHLGLPLPFAFFNKVFKTLNTKGEASKASPFPLLLLIRMSADIPRTVGSLVC